MLLGRILYPLLAALVITTGCGGESNTAFDQANTVQTESGSGLEFQLPVAVRESLAVDLNQVSGFANVNGRNFQMQRNNERFSVEIPDIPVNSDVDINITFIETLPNGGELTLAESDPQTFSVNESDQTIEFFQDQYNFPDDDGDGLSNLAERNNETDPFTAEITGTRTLVVQFSIPQIVQDPAITQVIALFADIPRPISSLAGVVEITGIVASGVPVNVDIRLIQQFENQAVLIADAIETLGAGVDNAILTLTDDDFDFLIDSDNDGITNLDELQQGTNPFEAN